MLITLLTFRSLWLYGFGSATHIHVSFCNAHPVTPWSLPRNPDPHWGGRGTGWWELAIQRVTLTYLEVEDTAQHSWFATFELRREFGSVSGEMAKSSGRKIFKISREYSVKPQCNVSKTNSQIQYLLTLVIVLFKSGLIKRK